jgi:hypothetical protein
VIGTRQAELLVAAIRQACGRRRALAARNAIVA